MASTRKQGRGLMLMLGVVCVSIGVAKLIDTWAGWMLLGVTLMVFVGLDVWLNADTDEDEEDETP